MKTAILLLIGATAGAYAQNLAWDYDAFGWTIVALPGVPIAIAAALMWRRKGQAC